MKKVTKKTTAPVAPVAVVAGPAASQAPVTTKTVTAAPVATPAPAAPVKAAPAPAAKTPIVAAPITIEAKIDVGFGNKLFARGQGAGLSWDHGIPLECVDSQTWRLIVPAKDKLQFKLLLNDSVWAQGEDVVAAPGKKVEVTPAF